MVVTSGIVPYQYYTSVNDSWFHFRAPSHMTVAPSAVLFEEAMYVIKAEYTRRDAGGIVFNSDVLGDTERYNLYMSNNAQGSFDPDPDGGYLEGTLPTIITTTEGVSYTSYSPATYNMKAYIKDMRETLREVLAQVAVDAGGSISHWNMVTDYLRIYKGYTDPSFPGDGFFLNEIEHPVTFEPSSSGMMISGELLFRHLDEVRYQPIPFLSGVGGDFLAETKGEMYLQPMRPVYWNTAGNLGPGWNTVEAYGDVLIGNTAIMLSGGGKSGQGSDTYQSVEWTANAIEDIQQSGSFSPIVGMTKGVYISLVGNSGTGPESGLAPWGSGYSGFPRVARVPNAGVNMPSSGGQQYSLIVEDDIFAIQANLGGGGGLGESGLQWRMPMGDLSSQVDFYITQPSNSGVRRLWGNSLYAQKYSELGDSDLYRPGGWMYDRGNNQIIGVGSSGFAGGHTDYPTGTGMIIKWGPNMQFVSRERVPAFVGPEVSIDVEGLESITYDGTNYICNGWASLAEDPTLGSGVVWKLNSSFAPIDMISGTVDGGDNVKGKIFWHRGNSEYLWLDNSGSARFNLEEYPNRFNSSGTYHVATLNWGALTGPEGTMSMEGYVPTIADSVSGLWGPASYATIRMLDLFNQEGTDDLYGMCFAFDTSAGGGSGGATNYKRWVVKFDDTGGHPYEISEAWLLGSDDSPNDLNTSIRNSKFLYFMDNFQF